MADSVTLAFRPIYLEDFGLGTTVGFATATVLGAGPVPVTPLLVAVNDAAALAGGGQIGQVYLCIGFTPFYLRSLQPLSAAGINATVTTAPLTTTGFPGNMVFTGGVLTSQVQST